MALGLLGAHPVTLHCQNLTEEMDVVPKPVSSKGLLSVSFPWLSPILIFILHIRLKRSSVIFSFSSFSEISCLFIWAWLNGIYSLFHGYCAHFYLSRWHGLCPYVLKNVSYMNWDWGEHFPSMKTSSLFRAEDLGDIFNSQLSILVAQMARANLCSD